MGVLEELHAAITGVAEQSGRSVVGIGDRFGLGSGIVVAEGKVLTNAHNVRAEEIAVTFGDGRRAVGELIGVDPDGDLAVVAVDTADTAPLAFADPSVLSVGLPVFGASNPGGRGFRVTFGVVSGVERSFPGPRGRTIRGAVEHTAPLLPGSSGGPLLDASGAALGLNTNRLGEGFYLAIPTDEHLRSAVDALSRGESLRRARLGVGIAPPAVARGLRRAVGLPEAEGLLVRHVEPDAPAGRAGVREGDLIVEVGGRPATSVDALSEALDGAGTHLEVGLLRGTEKRTVTVSLEEAS